MVQGFKGNVLKNKLFYANNIKKEDYICQTNGSVSGSIVENWTLSALECYRLNFDCSKCPIRKANYSFKCQMDKIVKVLLKTKGKPDEKSILNSSYNKDDKNPNAA